EQNSLLAFFEPIGNRLRQFLRKNRSDLSFSPFLTKIDNPHQRHALIVDALSESKQLVFTGGGVVITLERRRGAAEHNRAFLDLCPHDRDVARMITRSFLLFVSRFMFFIDNDESEVLQGREDRAARADHNSGASGMELVPFVVALAFRSMAVQ